MRQGASQGAWAVLQGMLQGMLQAMLQGMLQAMLRLCSRPKHRPSWASWANLGRRAHLAEPREGADHAAQLRTVRVARLVAELVVRAVLGRPPDGPALGGEAAEQGEQHAHLVTGQGRGEGWGGGWS